ncbi:MAG: RHS repeat-associated core domain-containing protein, partial [Planctomycetota bacterium]|nr:RHS repeat-associated core domain-containing protein [Planctomycetota bacterium]
HIALQFDGDSPLTNRYLHGAAIDQVLADEQFTPTGANEMPSTPGDVIWPLADHLGTIRDLATYEAGVTTIANHRVFGSFGNLITETNDAIDHIFAYTGRELDEETGMNYHRNRYTDPLTGGFISEDPIGFAGDMSNLVRYVGNRATQFTDPKGLETWGETLWQTMVVVGEFYRGAGQGVLNVANGVQDAGIGVLNLPAAAHNLASWSIGTDIRAPYIPSPDWSRDMIVEEEYHETSKFFGGQGALTLVTLGASQLGAVSQGSKLGHITTATAEAKIVASGSLIARTGKTGIFALKDPSTSGYLNRIRTLTSGSSTTVVPIPQSAVGAFQPIPVVGLFQDGRGYTVGM